jgi:hypothetical protein
VGSLASRSGAFPKLPRLLHTTVTFPLGPLWQGLRKFCMVLLEV